VSETGSIRFLTVDLVLGLHARAIREHGGSPGLRDRRLLESAVAMPAQGFGGQYFHPTLHEMAAAYLFHLCMNHPFEDGNKRVALTAALVFLDLNGFDVNATNPEVRDLTLAVAAGRLGKSEVALFIKDRLRAKKK
jgi:death on curing protein